MKKEYDLKGNIRSNSNILCEMIITSDNAFFNKIGLEETHLVYISIIHTTDKEGNDIEKIYCRDFWKGIDSYRQLQNVFHKLHICTK